MATIKAGARMRSEEQGEEVKEERTNYS